jgi:clusterin-associated protein 1
MSFRELRNFCEMMRALGYPRLVSMENFRSPNFPLVADLLDWLLHRFEPNASIPDDITTEAQRVEFIKVVCTRIVDRTSIKLNPRKLYGGDGYAVKELLRLATVLYDAQRSVCSHETSEVVDDSFGLSSRLSDLKNTRALCSQIVESGASLFDLLDKERECQTDREKALRFLEGMSRNLDSNSESDLVERSVMQLLGSHSANLEQLKQMSEELQRDEKSLEQKIKKKRQELDRCKKRLSSLVNVRPAFMDEYEQLEQELERYYEQYVGRFRNLDYLEHEIDVLNREETERMEENDRALKRMQKRLRDEEWRIIRGEDDEKGGARRKPPKAGKKQWAPPNGAAGFSDEEENSSAISGSESPAISLADDRSSQGSGDELGDHGGVGGHALARDAPVSLGGSVTDDDILNESEISEDEGGGLGLRGKGGLGAGGSDFDF